MASGKDSSNRSGVQPWNMHEMVWKESMTEGARKNTQARLTIENVYMICAIAHFLGLFRSMDSTRGDLDVALRAVRSKIKRVPWIPPPNEKSHAGSMPDAGKKEDDKDVERPPCWTHTGASKGEINVIPEPSGQ